MSSFGWGNGTPESAIGHTNPWEADEAEPLSECPECACSELEDCPWDEVDQMICSACRVTFDVHTGTVTHLPEETEYEIKAWR